MQHVEAFARADSKEAVPPVLDRIDAVGALEDREIRNRVRGMTAIEQGKIAQRLLDGEYPRVLEAILRHPMGIPVGVLTDIAPAAWIANRDRADPAQAHLRRDAAERTDLLRERMGQIANALSQLSPAQRQAAVIAAASAGRT